MSERIYTLARAAGLIAPHGSDREGLRDFDYRMFARLIVQECAGKVDFILREKSNGGGTMGDEIREHFGVKE
jgi:hypothetical protein